MEQPLTKAQAETLIRRVALLPGAVGYRSYCRMRMGQRRVDALDVERILKNATLERPAYKRNDEWRYRVAGRFGVASGIVAIVVVITEDRIEVHNVLRTTS